MALFIDGVLLVSCVAWKQSIDTFIGYGYRQWTRIVSLYGLGVKLKVRLAQMQLIKSNSAGITIYMRIKILYINNI